MTRRRRIGWFDDPLVERGPAEADEAPQPPPEICTDDLPVVLFDADERPLRRRVGFTAGLTDG